MCSSDVSAKHVPVGNIFLFQATVTMKGLPGYGGNAFQLACLQFWMVLQNTMVLRAILRSSCESKASRFRAIPVSSFRGSPIGPLQSISTYEKKREKQLRDLARHKGT